MTGIAVLAVLVVAALGIAWSRMTTSRAERRSVDAYERQLDVLGHVAERSDASAGIHKPSPSELARPHVRPSDAGGSFIPSKNEYRPVSPPRVRLEPPLPPSRTAPLPVFGDEVEPITGRPLGKVTEESLRRRSKMFRRRLPRTHPKPPELHEKVGEILPVVEAPREVEEPLFPLDSLVGTEQPTIVFEQIDEPVVVRPSAHRSTCNRRVSDRTHRRALTGTAAAILVAAVAVGGWQIASKQQPTTPVAKAGAGGSSQHSHSPKSHSSSPFSNAPGSSLQPISNTSGLVTYPAPSGTYTISFSAQSDCWLGIQPGSNAQGTYLAMKTLTSADTWSYQANGAIVVRIGAPRTLSVKINGEQVASPSTIQPYDITFVLSGSTSA